MLPIPNTNNLAFELTDAPIKTSPKDPKIIQLRIKNNGFKINKILFIFMIYFQSINFTNYSPPCCNAIWNNIS